MPQFLVAIQLPDDFDPSRVDPAMERDIDVLNEEIVAAGIGVFVGGLRPAREAKSFRAQPDGKVLITDGPYLETKEHIGGFWVIEVANMDEAGTQGRPRLPGAGRGAGRLAARRQLNGVDERAGHRETGDRPCFPVVDNGN